MTSILKNAAVQDLLDRASGVNESGGNDRLKVITRDLLEAIMAIIEKHDVSESEFWQAVKYLQDGAAEFGLIVPGVGLEHFMDLLMDAKDAEAGRTGGTPRTIEGPLYVEGAPLAEGDVNAVIGAFRQQVNSLALAEFERSRKRLGDLSEEQEEALRVMINAIVNKFTQPVIKQLRESENGHSPYLSAWREAYHRDEEKE